MTSTTSRESSDRHLAITRLAKDDLDREALALLPTDVLVGDPGTVGAHRTSHPQGWAARDTRGVDHVIFTEGRRVRRLT